MASGIGASALHTGLLWDHVPYPIDGQVLANRLIVYARLANAERRIRIDASELAHSRRERAQLRSTLTRLQTRDPDTGPFTSRHFNQYRNPITTDQQRPPAALNLVTPPHRARVCPHV